MRARFLAVVVTLLTALAIGAGPAAASTGGTPDGNTHPNVGLILFYQPDGRFRCSATLISPTVLLTAAHCTDADLGSVLVDFRSVVALQPPNGYPVAADAAVGYTDAEINAAGFLSGTAYTHPEYSHFTDLDNWNDVGVVVLDQPVTGIAPASARLGADAGRHRPEQPAQDALHRGRLRHRGAQAGLGPQKPTPMSYPLIRRYVDMPGQKLTPQILQTNGNEHDVFGTGGTCFGDSGGPVFYQGSIVAVTSYGYTDNCRYLGGYQRVDIAVTQDWVRSFL